MDTADAKICGYGKHQTQGMVIRRGIFRKRDAFKAGGAHFYLSLKTGKNTNTGSQVDRGIDRAGRQGPQRQMERLDIERSSHVDPAGSGCFDRGIFQNISIDFRQEFTPFPAQP